MQSSFEGSAQRAAVEAVERRWAQRNAAARRTARTSVAKSCLGWLLLLGALLAGGAYAVRHFGLDVSDFSPFRFVKRQVLGVGDDLTEAERARIDAFAGALAAFDRSDILPWKSAPQEVRPKHAPGGFTYRMLIERIGGTCGIYEMVANGKGGVSVYELSPMGKPMKVTLADFNRAKGGSVYLIDCGGKVYVCGAGTGEAGVAFARRLLGK